MPSKSNEQVRIPIANPEKVSVCVTGSSPTNGSPNLAAGDVHGSENVWLGSKRDPVSRSVSNRSQAVASSDKGGQGDGQKHKEKKLGHRRIRKDGEVTYKKFETTQLIGSIQLGIQHSVGGLANVPDRDLLMQDFMSIDTVSFTRDGLLQKTPAHNYSEFRFRTYASFAFRRFRKLFNIETDLYLASICSEPMIELSNPGVSGSIFYVTSDDNFICKTVLHKEAEFLQKISLGYYLNLEQNQRTLLPKFFGLYCYSCNAKNVRLVVMNNLFPSELKMHHKFDLKGSTYKRKANRHERAKKSPTYKDLDFMDMYPDGITLQNDIYHSLMNSIQRDCIVLESFKIMDYSLLIGIHNLDQAAKDRDEGARMDDASDCESGSHTTDKNFDRQGSIIHRERMIAHSTALESITMEVGSDNHHVSSSHHVSHDASSPPNAADPGGSYDGVDGGGINNVWGGIPAKNHRGENLLLFIGIIDILQSYGMLKKVEHYWKSLIHDGDTVSVHRPGFYARRFQSFMKEKVFRKQVSNVKPTLSFRRDKKQEPGPSDHGQQLSSPAGGPPVRGTKDNAITVIAIDSTGASTNLTDEVFLPPVLQDRKPRTISGSGKNSTSSTSGDGAGELTQPDVAPETEAASKPEPVFSSPDIKTPRSAGNTLARDNADTGSIITMTSDERVQIFVPSPSGGGTPYSTITKTSNLEFQRVVVGKAAEMSSPRLPSTSISWNEISPVKTGSKMNLPQKSSSGGLEQEELGIPPFARRVTATPIDAYRSLTPLNMEYSNSSTPSKQSSSPRRAKPSTDAEEPFGLPLDELKTEPLSLSDIQLIDKENTQS